MLFCAASGLSLVPIPALNPQLYMGCFSSAPRKRVERSLGAAERFPEEPLKERIIE